MENKFIILVTAYNDAEWVEWNLASILNQTYTNYEVMYYDDASSDDTHQKVLDIVGDNNKFKITTRKKNKGTLHNYIDCIKKLKKEEIKCIVGAIMKIMS